MTTLQHRVAVVGCGMMGEALVSGWISSGTVAPDDIIAVAPRIERSDYLTQTYGITAINHASELSAYHLGPDDIVVLAVKPHLIFEVIPSVQVATEQPLWVSIAAGLELDSYQEVLGDDARIVRVMPNTAATVGASLSLISPSSACSINDTDAVVALFDGVGRTAVIEERLQNAGSAISGCGPAYFALIIAALKRAGVTQGLTGQQARDLAVQTMYGTALMLRNDDSLSPEDLIDRVTSPGGTTIAGLNELEDVGVRTAFNRAVAAVVDRAEEMAFEGDDEFFDIEIDEEDEE